MSLSTSIPGPAYRIITPRLVIKCLEPRHAIVWGAAIEESLAQLLPWMPWAKEWPLSLDDRIELLRKWRGNFDLGLNFEYAIFSLDETTLLGAAGLHTRNGPGVHGIGYWIHKDHFNQGFATEVVGALTKVAFEIDHVRRVEILCDPENIASASIPRKLKFTHEATLHHRIEMSPGNFRDSMLWSLFEENYLSSPAAYAEITAFDAIGRRIL